MKYSWDSPFTYLVVENIQQMMNDRKYFLCLRLFSAFISFSSDVKLVMFSDECQLMFVRDRLSSDAIVLQYMRLCITRPQTLVF